MYVHIIQYMHTTYCTYHCMCRYDDGRGAWHLLRLIGEWLDEQTVTGRTTTPSLSEWPQSKAS